MCIRDSPRAGQPVKHKTQPWGLGRIEHLDAGGREPIATVRFASGSVKQIALRFLDLLSRDEASELGGD